MLLMLLVNALEPADNVDDERKKNSWGFTVVGSGFSGVDFENIQNDVEELQRSLNNDKIMVVNNNVNDE